MHTYENLLLGLIIRPKNEWILFLSLFLSSPFPSPLLPSPPSYLPLSLLPYCFHWPNGSIMYLSRLSVPVPRGAWFLEASLLPLQWDAVQCYHTNPTGLIWHACLWEVGNWPMAAHGERKPFLFHIFGISFLAAGKVRSSFMFVADIEPFCGGRRKRWRLSVSYTIPELY